ARCFTPQNTPAGAASQGRFLAAAVVGPLGRGRGGIKIDFPPIGPHVPLRPRVFELPATNHRRNNTRIHPPCATTQFGCSRLPPWHRPPCSRWLSRHKQSYFPIRTWKLPCVHWSSRR